MREFIDVGLSGLAGDLIIGGSYLTNEILTAKKLFDVMNTFSYTFLIPIPPLLMFLFIGLTGHKFKPIVSGVIGTVSLGIVTLLSYATAIQYFWGVGKIDEVFQTIIPYNYTWLQFWGNFKISMGMVRSKYANFWLILYSRNIDMFFNSK